MNKIILMIVGFFFSLTIIAQKKSDDKNENSKSKTENAKKEKSKAQHEKEEKIKKVNKEYKKSAKADREKRVKDKYEKDIKDEREKKVKEELSKKVWDGTSDKSGNGPKFSKNQPAKVRGAFQQDYPNARNVAWSKYRGDWTATFGSGLSMSTAVYHANGERRDTRTPVTSNEVPGNILDSIFKRRPGTKLEEVIKIERPNGARNIFRIKDNMQGNTGYYYYDSEGQTVQYDY